MSQKAVFYHAGCPVCVAAEHKIAEIVDSSRYDLEIVHLGEARDRIAEAERAGVKSVPALVVENVALHINYGADLADLKGGA